jgi:signal transduction histidine kinase
VSPFAPLAAERYVLGVFPRFRPTLVVVAGFFIGLALQSFDKVLPHYAVQGGAAATVAKVVDWTAPPLAGALLAAALLAAQRYKRLHEAERAASRVLADRLTGVERRQALWVVAAAIAHDLKNPLHNLQLLMEELEEEPNPGRRAEMFKRLRENVERASARVSELSRAGRAPEDVQQPLDLAAALDDLHKRITTAARANGTELIVDCPRGLAVRGDALALRSAVENVVANSLEALQQNGRGGRLALRARQVNSAVELTVEDDGPGIPDEVLPRLFAPFSSGRESTGLGLAIARALARSSGGDLTCADPSSGHTCFRFTFPGPQPARSDERPLRSAEAAETIADSAERVDA